MKKRILILLLALAMMFSVFAGCSNDEDDEDDEAETEEEVRTESFEAEIIDIDGDMIMVEPLEGEKELRSSDRITFSAKDLKDIDAEVGCIVKITYNGMIRETYPASIDVIRWKMIECNLDDIVDDKPVIYLYPEEETEVSVLLKLQGDFTCTYPAYDSGWQVTAAPDGTLTDENGQTYNYLYWEGVSGTQYDLSQGFCVKGADTAAFLETALAQLGLNRREANEFIVYWLPLMEQNPYNIISFQFENYTDAAQLEIYPQPDTVIRVFMAWKAADAYMEMTPQILTAPQRTGFTVVEWGGTEIQ